MRQKPLKYWPVLLNLLFPSLVVKLQDGTYRNPGWLIVCVMVSGTLIVPCVNPSFDALVLRIARKSFRHQYCVVKRNTRLMS